MQEQATIPPTVLGGMPSPTQSPKWPTTAVVTCPKLPRPREEWLRSSSIAKCIPTVLEISARDKLMGALSSYAKLPNDWQASLRSRDAFWDIPVTKTHSTFDNLIVPRPPCVRAASPHHRKLGAGYAGTPSMAGRHDRMRSLPPLWRASARRVGSIASWLPGTTRPRFALHGAQRMVTVAYRPQT